MIHEIASLPRKFTESEVIEHRLPNRGTNPRENVVPEQKVKLEQVVATTDEVFDRAHLGRYTMNDEGLEHEILSLFLTQLKATVEMIETANSAAEWKLWTHTLKGAAAAIGHAMLPGVEAPGRNPRPPPAVVRPGATSAPRAAPPAGAADGMFLACPATGGQGNKRALSQTL